MKALTVHRMHVGQRGDAAYAKSIRGVPGQPNPAEAAEGEPLGMAQARIVSVPMVAVENRPAVPVMAPRDHKARRFYIRREVELSKYGFSDDCVAQVGAEAKPLSEGCRERIRKAMMLDDVGQQRLRAAEQRGSSAGEQPSVATKVEAAWEGRERLLRSARNVRPRTAESARMEDVVPSRKRGSEWMGPPDDPNLTPADESQMGISEMAVILMSLGAAPANFKVAELSCRNIFGGSVVDIGFERGLLVVCTRGKATCVDFSWQRTVSRKDPGSCRTQSTSSRSWASVARTKVARPRIT